MSSGNLGFFDRIRFRVFLNRLWTDYERTPKIRRQISLHRFTDFNLNHWRPGQTLLLSCNRIGPICAGDWSNSVKSSLKESSTNTCGRHMLMLHPSFKVLKSLSSKTQKNNWYDFTPEPYTHPLDICVLNLLTWPHLMPRRTLFAIFTKWSVFRRSASPNGPKLL